MELKLSKSDSIISSKVCDHILPLLENMQIKHDVNKALRGKGSGRGWLTWQRKKLRMLSLFSFSIEYESGVTEFWTYKNAAPAIFSTPCNCIIKYSKILTCVAL